MDPQVNWTDIDALEDVVANDFLRLHDIRLTSAQRGPVRSMLASAYQRGWEARDKVETKPEAERHEAV